MNILVSNYTSKHITFNKGEYVGTTHRWNTTISSQPRYTLNTKYYHGKNGDKKGWTKYFQTTTSKATTKYQNKLTELLKEYDSQFAQDETTIGTTPLTEMTIDTGTSEPVTQKPYPIAMKYYKRVKEEINKLLIVKVIQGSQSSWSAPITVVPKGNGGKCQVINYHAINKVTWKFIWPMPKLEDIFSQLYGAKYFSTLDLWAGCHHIPLDEYSIPKTAFTSLFGKYEYIKVPFGLVQAPAYCQELMTDVLKDFSFTIAYLDYIIIFSRTAEEHLTHIKHFQKIM